MSTEPGPTFTGQDITGGTGQPPTPPPIIPPTVTPVTQEEVKPKRKVFGPNDLKRVVPVDVSLPAYYDDDFEPWGFEFRVALSDEMQKQREEWLGLPSKQADEKNEGQILDELCDLLVRDPTGIGGFPEGHDSPGDKLRAWFGSITDPAYKHLVRSMLRAASTLYWNRVSPREFRP